MVETLTNFLLAAAQIALSAWDGVKSILGAVFGAIDSVVGPVLSVVFGVLDPIATTVGDGVYACLSPFPPWVGITLISGVTGVVLMLSFRLVSNQDAITRAKDDIKANLLALKLFKEDLRTVALSQVRLLWAICKLQRYVLTPVLVAMPVMLLLLSQMGVRYQWRPAHAGEPVVIKMTVDPEAVDENAVRLIEHDGVTVEAGPVPGGGIVTWRLSARDTGRYVLGFDVGGRRVTKEFVVQDTLCPVSELRPGANWVDRLFHPTERPLPEETGVRSIEVVYPSLDSYVCGADWWVAYFFAVSMTVALIFKPILGVKF